MGLLLKTLRVSSGKIFLEKEDLTTCGAARLRKLRGARMAMIFQEPMTALNPVMSCGAQIEEVFRIHTGFSSSEITEKATALLREVSIPDPQRILASYPHQLSGGQRQRVALARALAAVRERFGGPVTYASIPFEGVDWTPFDIVSVDAHRSKEIAHTYRRSIAALIGGTSDVPAHRGSSLRARRAFPAAHAWAGTRWPTSTKRRTARELGACSR